MEMMGAVYQQSMGGLAAQVAVDLDVFLAGPDINKTVFLLVFPAYFP